MTFGQEGTEGKLTQSHLLQTDHTQLHITGARVYTVKDVEAIFDVFQSHGHTEVRRYLEAS